MVFINDIDSQRFSVNGIEYFKNFMPIAVSDYLKIVGVYDSKVVLITATIFSNFTVNGNTYDSVGALQTALLPVTYTRDTLGVPGTEISGNIKPRLISIPYFDEPTLAHFAARINAEPSFTILDGQLPVFYLFHLTFEAIAKPSFRMFSKLGSGTYGIGGTQLTAFDLIDVIQVTASIEEIEAMEGTQIIDLGEIGSANPWTVLNGKNPKLPIQNQISGYRLVKTLVSGVSVRYLFLGVGGDYGVGGLQSVAADFAIQSGEVPSVTAISVQNGAGVNQFTITNILKFEGVSFDPLGKKIKINALIPLAAFLDVTNGNDSTAALENSKAPFKTIDALLEALPATTGETYTIFITGGNVSFAKRVASRSLKWVAYSLVTLDFSLVKEADGITDAEQIFTTQYTGATWYFENENISIISNYVGTKAFTFSGDYGIIMRGTINVLNWKSAPKTLDRGFVFNPTSDWRIKTLYDSSQFGSSIFWRSSGKLIIDNYITANRKRVSNGHLSPLFMDIKKITSVGSVTSFLQIGGEINKIGDIVDFNGTVKLVCAELTLNGKISSGCTLDYVGVPLVQGFVESTTYGINVYCVGQVYRNFTGKLKDIKIVESGVVTFENCIIETNGRLVEKYSIGASGGSGTSTREDIIVLKGVNTITQIGSAVDLFDAPNAFPPTSSKKIIVTDYGLTKTNVLSYGKNVSAIYVNNTFKEKANEIVIRSKLDLVNRDLDSNMNYIIDGVITLSATDRIIVPIGGLSISGYGFDVSAIKATNANSIIFSSPIGGSGNLFASNLSLEASGTGSKVFDLTNAGAPTGGADAIELNVVNFDNCTSLGEVRNFRQGLWDNIGLFGCKDGLTFSGTWSGGFRADLVIVRNFGIAGTESIVFKSGTDLIFKSRFLTDLNADFKTMGLIDNFAAANFESSKLYQLKAAEISLNGVKDATHIFSKFLNAFSAQSDWSGNNGIKNSAEHPYSIKVDRMPKFASEALAIAAGLTTDDVYIDTSLKTFKVIS